MFRRLGSSLAAHRASLSTDLGSLWDFIRADRDRGPRRRSAPAACERDTARSPARLARDLLQVVQETVFVKKFDERRCPLVKEESGLSSEEGTDRRIANLIDFFFTIVKSQRDDRKSSTGSCFKTESPTETKPKNVNLELEKKMETLMEFLATTGCMEDDATKDEKKITLMEFLFGPENRPTIEIDALKEKRQMTLSESNINVKLSYIDETPVDEESNLVDMLIKYMENYEKEPTKYMTVTPSMSEKSKSDVTLSKIETFDNISKTKSDSTLTHTQDTVVEREIDIKSDKSQSSRRISETVVDLSNIKQDLEDIIAQAVVKVCELNDIDCEEEEYEEPTVNENDTMSEAEDMQNFHSYTKPLPLYTLQCMPYSVELSDIIEEDESLDPSSRAMQEDRLLMIRECAEDLLDFIEDKIQRHFDDDSDEFDVSSSLKRSSVSLIDLRLIPDLPPSMFIKPKVKRVDKSTSTTEISDSISDISRRIDSGNVTEDTSLSNSSERQAERALDKLVSLNKFFSRSRLDIIKESQDEEKKERKKRPRSVLGSETKSSELKPGQASLDDVEELQDEVLDYNEVEKLSDDVIIEENEKEIDNDDVFTEGEGTFEGVNNIEEDEDFGKTKAKRNTDLSVDEIDIKVGTVSEEIVNEEVTEDFIIEHTISADNADDGGGGGDQNDLYKASNDEHKCVIPEAEATELIETICKAKVENNESMSNENDVKKTNSEVDKSVKARKLHMKEDLCKNELNDSEQVNISKQSVEDKVEVNVQDADDRDISETDFTEIDKIIADAVKIVLVNELEFHDLERKKQKELANVETSEPDRNGKNNKHKKLINTFDTDKEIAKNKKEISDFKNNVGN